MSTEHENVLQHFPQRKLREKKLRALSAFLFDSCSRCDVTMLTDPQIDSENNVWELCLLRLLIRITFRKQRLALNIETLAKICQKPASPGVRLFLALLYLRMASKVG